jgi:hypothetical protein
MYEYENIEILRTNEGDSINWIRFPSYINLAVSISNPANFGIKLYASS